MDAVLVTTSSSIVCLAGQTRKDGTYAIFGQAKVPFSGIRKGVAVSAFGLQKGISDVILKLEEQVGKRIKRLTVGVPAPFCQVSLVGGAEPNADQGPNAFEYMSDAYELIHRLNVPRVGAGPSGLGSVSSIGASRAYTDEVNQALAKLKMRAASFYAQPLAEGIFLLPKPVRSAIAVLLDVGYYNIGISVFIGDALVYCETLYVGGYHIANDLAQVLKVPMEYAEQLKRQFSFGIEYDPEAQDYARSAEGKLIPFSHSAVAEVIQARVEETCDYIRQAIDHAPVTFTEKSVAQLAGDGYEGIRGIREILSTLVGLPVQGLPISLADGSTHYDVAALALFDALAIDQPEKSSRRPGWTSRFTKR